MREPEVTVRRVVGDDEPTGDTWGVRVTPVKPDEVLIVGLEALGYSHAEAHDIVMSRVVGHIDGGPGGWDAFVARFRDALALTVPHTAEVAVQDGRRTQLVDVFPHPRSDPRFHRIWPDQCDIHGTFHDDSCCPTCLDDEAYEGHDDADHP